MVLYKASRYVDLNSKKMVEIHGDASGFQELQKETYASLGSEVFLTSLVVKKNESLLDLVEEMQSSILPYARIVSPVRALPEKFYMHRRKNNAQGLHFASIWMLFNKSKKNNQYLKDIDQFGVDSGLFEKLSVKGVSSKFPDSPLIVEVQRNGKKLFVNQVGVGVSQVVPVLIDTVFALKAGGKIVLLQQPELHLHPVAQAALGSYLFKVAREGLCGVVETHSSYLLDRFRADLRDCNNADGGGFTGGVQMLFCESGPKGNQIHEVGVGKSGQLIGEPDRYHQFFIDEYVRTMF